jgi:low temperature requirement protein LtrA
VIVTSIPHFAHSLRRMTGRDPQEVHRAATPLELLFDLTFVVAFGVASSQTAHLLAEGHVGPALLGFGFALFAISWAWINFSWFASAYDTDDWLFRVLTMVQMIGVVVLALGLPTLFESLDHGRFLDNTIVVLGYVIMRVALVLQWLRAAKQDPARKLVALSYAKYIALIQIGWVVIAILQVPVGVALPVSVVLFAAEMAIPVVAEGKGTRAGVGSTPWHAHHIAERYGLLAIIALGEVVFGTVTAATAVMDESGWNGETAILVITGIGLAFGLWWTYFILDAGVVLKKYRERAFVWGYGHVLIFASIIATGTGLHMVEYLIEHHTEIGIVGTVVSVALPVFVFMLTSFVLYAWVMRSLDPLHVLLVVLSALLLAAGVVAAALGAPIGVCLILVTLSPYVVVVGYETLGHRHQAERLAKVLA